MRLYEINKQILNCIDEETGEIKNIETLTQLSMAREEKLEQIALWHKNELASAEAYKREKEVFAERERLAKNKAESLKKWLADELQGEKLKTDRVIVSYRKSEQVTIEDGIQLTDEYLTYKEPQPNKTEIKKALKSGIEIKGVSLIERQNIQIK